VPDDAADTQVVHEFLRDGRRLGAVAAVVSKLDAERHAVDAAGGVDLLERELGAVEPMRRSARESIARLRDAQR